MNATAKLQPLAEWPAERRRQLSGVLTDIDDTLTTDGALTPEVLAAINGLRQAGLRVIAVTGRPTYWAMPLLKLCRFDAVIAENGASAFWHDATGAMQSWFYADAATRRQHRATLEDFISILQQKFPDLPVADDAPQRVGDLAFDIGEHVPPRIAAEVEEIVRFIGASGFHTTASSIHVHASLVRFCKQESTDRVLRMAFGIDDAIARERWAFVGDSGNDAAMFAHFPYAIGVANIARHLDHIDSPPAYVTRQACGAGFVEAALAILSARQIV